MTSRYGYPTTNTAMATGGGGRMAGEGTTSDETAPLLSNQGDDSEQQHEQQQQEQPRRPPFRRTPSYGSRRNSSAGRYSVDYRDGLVSMGRRVERLDSISDHVTPLTLSWKDIEVDVNVPKGSGRDDVLKACRCCGRDLPATCKQILKGVTGVVEPGDLLAIMGASGAGKSTLLNVLTGRNTKNYHLTGDVRLNGWNVGQHIRDVSAYVQQDDIFISTLTVREQLQFRALLRMDKRFSTQARLNRVEEVIMEMGLAKCAESRIGDAGGAMKGLSGGERKRLSFASESLTNPPIFFCDEPTSGLDTFMAQNIVQTLQDMAARGHTILCTIHQPSSELFSMFSRILLLAEGRTAFMGPTEAAINFFDKMQFPCPTNFNPADHYILTLAIVPGKEIDSKKRANMICDKFAESEEGGHITSAIQELEDKASRQHIDPYLEDAQAGESRYEASWCTQFRNLLWRSWISLFRDMALFRVRVFQTLVVALILGLVYLRIELDQKGVQDINGAIFLLITNISFTNLFAVVNSFPLELAVFMREYGTGLYRVDTYFISKTLAEVPLFIVLGTFFTTVCYWMMGLNDEWEKFLIAVAVLLLTGNVAVSLGYLVSTICGAVNIALAVAPPLMIPLMLFGGLFVNSDNIPVYFIWLEYVSWFKYANEVLMVNQWDGLGYIPCGNKTTVPASTLTTYLADALSNVTTMASTGPPGEAQCAYRNGNDVLNYASWDTDNVVVDIFALAGLLMGFRILSFIALVVRARRSKT